MPQDRYNLYKIDDILIRIGWVVAGLALLVAWPLLAAVSEEEPAAAVRTRLGAFLFLAVPATACLAAGYRVRGKERRAVTIWKKLELAGSIAAADLEAPPGMTAPASTKPCS